jgi:LytS/YehU family sensor histidine kinase
VRVFGLTLLALVPAAALVSVVPILMQRLGFAVIFKGSLAARVVAEVVTSGLALALALAHEAHQRARLREAQALQLEARLSEARLQALAAQLRPHYLFNTLNAISVVVHRDPAAADAMIVGLADLLRATLHERDAHEIPVAEEVALLDRYLGIMRHRFGPRLATEVTVAPDAMGLLVPPFVLQPLVENALEHGIGRRAGEGTLRVTIARAGDRLRLEVVDDGAGLDPRRADGDDEGLGLTITRRRLEQLYGDAQRLVLAPGDGGRGARVTVELPARVAPAAALGSAVLPPAAPARVPA